MTQRQENLPEEEPRRPDVQRFSGTSTCTQTMYPGGLEDEAMGDLATSTRAMVVMVLMELMVVVSSGGCRGVDT